jgi:asparagine synthase (glutamine-hydrolysing)
MCGIIGIVSSNGQVKNQEWIKFGRDTMIHRGPDAEGEWWSSDRKIGFGHRRLSILELTSAGNQPMIDSNNGNSIVFNGEIYNYKELKNSLKNHGYNFITNSDTEVLLASYDMWGYDCVNKFNGMFAFALYDNKNKTIFLSRDRAGEKPLYYSLESNTLMFASELKPFLLDKNNQYSINSAALDCYLSLGYIPGDLCILDGFHKLKPANSLLFNTLNGEVNVWEYWNIPNYETINDNNDPCILIDELEALLQNSVNLQLTADVPIGVLLSGGVDSSLITAMACRSSQSVKTFTIGFPGYGQKDESSHAKLISNYFGTEHIVLNAEMPNSDLILSLAKQFDEPMVDSSMIPTYLVSNLVKKYCTVALGGDGGDELFGGYTSHKSFYTLSKKYQNIPLNVRKSIAKIAKGQLPVGFKGRNYLMNIGLDFKSEIPVYSELFDSKNRKKLLPNIENTFTEIIKTNLTSTDIDIIQRLTRTDFKNYLPEDILVKVDRASMMNSLEIRAPFLDYRLIEFAYSKVPSNMKTSTQDQKIILKHLAKRLLPREFDFHRKQGFSIPISDWLNKTGSFRDLFWSVLKDSECIFDSKAINKLLEGQDKGYSNGERIFSLVLFELWRREYSLSIN